MHFIGMVAYKMPLPVSYDVTLTLLSLVLAIAFTGFGLYMVIRRQTLSVPVLVGSGIIMGSGVAVMHYTGMAAMRFAAQPAHDQSIVIISLVIAIVASTAALWIAFTLRKGWQKFIAAFVMGAAVCGMHYTAMSGYGFTPTGESVEFFSAAILGNQLAGYVAGATVVVLTLALLAVFAKELRSAEHYQ
jgi:NO-binding membrane sensor protein with MHYT domain